MLDLPTTPPAEWASRSTWELIDKRRQCRDRAERYAAAGQSAYASLYERAASLLSAYLDPILSRPMTDAERQEELALCAR
jgi:hypothetical protein